MAKIYTSKSPKRNINEINAFIIKSHRRIHKERFCEPCGMMFAKKEDFIKHTRKFHRVKCEFCNCLIRYDGNNENLSRNMQNHFNAKHK